MENPHKPPHHHLNKVLGVAFGVAVVVGGTIGVGILRTPGSIAAALPNSGLILACWTLAGLFIVLSATSYAELTAMIPKAGGAYNYIRRAFGEYPGFLSGWYDYFCNAIAAAFQAIALGEYVGLLFPALEPYAKVVSIVVLTLFVAINLPGIKSGSITQQITSTLKVIIFLVLVVACFLGKPAGGTTATAVPAIATGALVSGIFLSLQLILGSYDGWMAVSFFAEEDRNPGRNIVRSYLIGSLSITALYVLINAALLHVLPVQAMAGSKLVAQDAAKAAFGNWSGKFIILLALFSLVSILNAYCMIPARILFGMSREAYFIKAGSLVNKGGTPYVTLLISYGFAVILIINGSFERLFRMSTFMVTFVTCFAFISLIALRKKEPNLARPYKVWGYPYSTLLAIIVSIALLVGFSVNDTHNFLVMLAITAASYPLFRLVQKRKVLPSESVT